MVYSDKIDYYRALNSPIETGDIYKPRSGNVDRDEALVIKKEGKYVICNYKDKYIKRRLTTWGSWGVRYKIKPKNLDVSCTEKGCQNKATDNGYCFKHG